MLLVMRKTPNAVSPYFPHSTLFDTTLYALALTLFRFSSTHTIRKERFTNKLDMFNISEFVKNVGSELNIRGSYLGE